MTFPQPASAGFFQGQPLPPPATDVDYVTQEEFDAHVLGTARLDVTTFGAVGDGVTDDTAAILRAAASLVDVGGVLWFPPGRYLVTRGTPLPSRSAAQAVPGTVTLVASAGFANPPTPDYSFFYNSGWNAPALAFGDHDISVSGFIFDYSWITTGNAFASLKMRYVTRLHIENNIFYYGGNAIAVRGCDRVWVSKNSAYGFRNCAWDFWEGPGTTSVTGNYAESDDTAQMLNFNPEVSPVASSPLGVIAKGLVVSGNVFKATGAVAEPCQIEPLADRDTGTNSVIISGNRFHRTYLVLRGAVRNVTITGNIFEDFPDPNTGVIRIHPLYGDTPDNISIMGNVINDPHTQAGGFGVIWVDATNAVVAGNVITGTYDAAPIYHGASKVVHYGNKFEKPGFTGRMDQGFLLTNPNDPVNNFRSCVGWEDTAGGALRMFMGGDFHEFWGTGVAGAPRQVWSLESNTSAQPLQWLIPVAFGEIIRQSTEIGITATGVSQPGARLLTANKNVVETVAAGTGVRLPAGTTTSNAGMTLTIWNRGADDLLVYPPTGAQINGLGANNPDTIPPGSCRTYTGADTTLYLVEV